MTATKAPHHQTRSRPAPVGRMLLVLITTFATAIALLAGATGASAQDGTATPTPQDLQLMRDQAIASGVEQLELTFEEYNDSGIDGTVTLYDLGGNRTLVAIEVTGGGEAHPAHIHTGTCGSSEPEPYKTLATVNDTGESLSLVDVALTDLIDGGDYTIDLHLSPSELGTLVACTNIEGTTAPATPAAGSTPAATVVPTGQGGQEPTPTATSSATAPATTETPTATATTDTGQATTPTPAATATTSPAVTPTEETLDGTGGAEAAPGSVASLPLSDYSGIGVTGTVSLVAIDDATTRVIITLDGDAVTGGHIAHLHPGTCDSLQSDGTIYLASVGADGVSSTTVALPLDALLNNGWSVNVHLSEADWDVWMVCGYLGNATGGMTGSTSVTPVTGGKGVPVTPANVVTSADGTSGVGGKGEPIDTSTITQGVGIGSTLAWPDSPARAIAWSLAAFALLLAATGLAMRRAPHRQPARWHRLGL